MKQRERKGKPLKYSQLRRKKEKMHKEDML